MTGEVKRDNINKRFTLSTLPLPYSHGKRGQMAIQRRHRGGRVNFHFLLPAQNRRKLNCSVHIIETQSLNRDYHHHQHFHPPPPLLPSPMFVFFVFPIPGGRRRPGGGVVASGGPALGLYVSLSLSLFCVSSNRHIYVCLLLYLFDRSA